jgi:hypothetical protein
MHSIPGSLRSRAKLPDRLLGVAAFSKVVSDTLAAMQAADTGQGSREEATACLCCLQWPSTAVSREMIQAPSWTRGDASRMSSSVYAALSWHRMEEMARYVILCPGQLKDGAPEDLRHARLWSWQG